MRTSPLPVPTTVVSHQLLIEAFGLRQAADYSATPDTVSEEDAQHTISEGKKFLDAAREYLKRQ
jgi:uncharacterized protein (UPF0332 family)